MAEDIEAMTRFEVPAVEDLPEDLRERIEEETERAGFTPNVFLALGYRPQTALEREEIEMLIVTVSGVNDCLYCIVAHGALCRIYADAPMLAEQLASNHRTADVNDAHRAMLDFAVKLTDEPAKIEDEDLERLRDHGFSQEAIWDIGNVVSFYNLSNRMAHLADMRPNEEFYTLGR
jgi:uncharacterized peroxidase-related enzyme